MTEKKKAEESSSGPPAMFFVIIVVIGVVAFFVMKKDIPVPCGGTGNCGVPTASSTMIVSDEPSKVCKKARVGVLVNQTKKNGDAWDARRGAPDIALKVDDIWLSPCSDSHKCAREVSVNGNSVFLEIWDEDVNEHDFIGKGSVDIALPDPKDLVDIEKYAQAHPEYLQHIGASAVYILCLEYE